MKRMCIALGFCVITLLGGCSFTPKSRLSENAPILRLEASQMVGVWTGTRLEDNHRHPSYQAINIREDGSGELVFSYVNKNGRYWVVGADFRLQGGPDGWLAQVVSPTVVFASNIHSDIMAGYFPQGSRYRLVTTANGLVLDRINDNSMYFVKQSAAPAVTVADVAVEKANQVLLAHGHSGAAQSNSGQLHAMTAAFQLGMGASAMANGNQAGALAGFDAAQRSAMSGLRGESYDPAAATRDALRTGIAIGSNGQVNPALDALASGSADTPAAPVAKEGEVVVTADMLANYPDGRAYDILILAPHGQSAGEFCFMYGVSLDSARAQLATAYALTGERSAYGPGNPRQQISYRSYPVSAGQSIRVGAEFHPGRMVLKPAGYTAYGDRPL